MGRDIYAIPDRSIELFRLIENVGKGWERSIIVEQLDDSLLRDSLDKVRLKKAQEILNADDLRVYGHCKAASIVYWLMMGGCDGSGQRKLQLQREKMRDGQLHFWVESEGGGGDAIIDVTAGQLNEVLYPYHDYKHGERVHVGSNRGRHRVKVGNTGSKVYRLDAVTFELLRRVVQELDAYFEEL